MKILVVLPSFEEKGPVIVAENIAKFSRNKNIEYVFLSLRKNDNDDLKRVKNFTNFELNIGGNPLKNYYKNKKNIIKIIKNIDPNVIHVHSFWPTIFVANSEFKNKTITTIHNNPKEDFVFEYGKIIGEAMSFFIVRAQKKIKKCIAISKYIEQLHRNLRVKKMETIYNGIEKVDTKRKEKKRKEIKLITISVLNKRKNIYFMIDVIKELVDKKKFITLDIIGDGEERKELEKYVKCKKLEGYVTFLGKIQRKNIFSLLKNSDVFILTSKSEGFGLVVVEAMMLGIPSIVSDIPVMKELIINGENGFRCNTVDEYVEKIMEISKKEKIELNCTRIYEEKFTVEEMCDRYEKLYFKFNKN